jgi:hypothetical protein
LIMAKRVVDLPWEICILARLWKGVFRYKIL